MASRLVAVAGGGNGWIAYSVGPDVVGRQTFQRGKPCGSILVAAAAQIPVLAAVNLSRKSAIDTMGIVTEPSRCPALPRPVSNATR